jgi:hypothetical protein
MNETDEKPSLDRLLAIHREIEDAATRQQVRLKLLGGLGIAISSPTEDEALMRGFGDVDFLAPRRGADEVQGLFRSLDYSLDPDSAQTVHRRQIWWPPAADTHVDVFLGAFEMCHTLDLEDRLDGSQPALPAADLLLSKLQIVELNEKDTIDVGRLLSTHELGADDSSGTINVPYIGDLLGSDWGFYTTVGDNLTAMEGASVFGRSAGTDAIEANRRRLLDALEEAPKSRGFRLRARVGRKARWYRLPEEVGDDFA